MLIHAELTKKMWDTSCVKSDLTLPDTSWFNPALGPEVPADHKDRILPKTTLGQWRPSFDVVEEVMAAEESKMAIGYFVTQERGLHQPTPFLCSTTVTLSFAAIINSLAEPMQPGPSRQSSGRIFSIPHLMSRRERILH